MTINHMQVIEKERKDCEREESGRKRRRKHQRSRGRGVKEMWILKKIPSVRKGVITGEDVRRKDTNKKQGG